MNAGLLILLLVIGAAVIGFFLYTGAKNGAVKRDEAVKAGWGNVQTTYQRRLDLVPNLVETVKGAANFEQDTLAQVTEARASVGRMTVDPQALLDNPELMQQWMEAQNRLGGALQRLLVVAENYPELKATQNFLSLQHELEGTENRINVARQDYNKVVADYNTFVRKIPNTWFLSDAEFPVRPAFEASAGAEQAPQVKF
ncbi:MAG: LemA family protein [Planctomycetota bacterium]|nr:MAG: LemA family protein [Planctomycetota bacterium]